MLKIKETEDENKLSFQNDFKRLLELSKGDSLAEKSYEFLLDLFDDHSSGFIVCFWNRFTGEIKREYCSYKNKQLEDIPHNGRDYLSWIPFFSATIGDFFTCAAVTKILSTKCSYVTVDVFKENKSDLIEVIKKRCYRHPQPMIGDSS